jgi:hypothetical protein
MNPLGAWLGQGRGQSEVIGLILVFGLVIGGATTVVVLGAGAIGDSQEALSDQRAEKALTQLDSKASLVALGSSDIQSIALPSRGSARYNIEQDAGWMNVSIDESSGGDTEIFNQSLGALVYENGNTRIAYQGGGVWRSTGEGSGVMVSPPEFHYRERTLTLPNIAISGSDSINGRAEISHANTVKHFPDPSRSDFSNPVEGDAINLTVHSEFYEAWGAYFETRTGGDVRYDHSREIAQITLVPPFDESYENAVATTDPNGITVNGADPPPTPNEEGANYPVVDSRIEDQISECQAVPSPCTTSIPDPISSPGTYFVDGDYSGSLDVDSPGGNVTVVINGELEPSETDYTSITDPHRVTVMVREDFDLSDDYNLNDGDAYESTVMLHSDGEFNRNGNSLYVGLVYAPRSHCDQNGGGPPPPPPNIRGGVVCESIDINGNPNKIEFDPAINDIGLGLTGDDVTQLQYLHVTINEITISGS